MEPFSGSFELEASRQNMEKSLFFLIIQQTTMRKKGTICAAHIMRVVDKQFGAMIHSSRSFGVADFELVVEDQQHGKGVRAFIVKCWAFGSHEEFS